MLGPVVFPAGTGEDRWGVVSGVRHDGGWCAAAVVVAVRAGLARGVKGGVAEARRPEVRLPALVAYEGGGLEPDGDYDGVRFDAVDLADESGPGARFMDCALDGCALDRTELARARFIDSVLTGVRGGHRSRGGGAAGCGDR